MRLILERLLSDDQGTVGQLMHKSKRVCWMNELPWRDNASNVSCIPPGVYDVKFLPRSASGRYRNVYHVTSVDKRGGILIHTGNYAGNRDKGLRTHSHGCLLPVTRWGTLNGQRAGLASRSALHRLRSLVGENNFTLEIRNA